MGLKGMMFGRRRGDSDLDARLQRLLYKADIPGYSLYDSEDLKNTLVEHVKDALLYAYGDEIHNALARTGRAVLKTLDNSALLFAILNDADDSEIASAFLVSIIDSYFLVKAIVEGSKSKVETALFQGADPTIRCRFHGVVHTPIVTAARTGDTDVCRLLIEAGADVNQAQSNSETALANASMLGDYFMAELLLENGANPNAVTHAGTALALAQNLAIVMLLGAAGADPNIPDSDGDLPIVGFIDCGRHEIVRLLVSMGSDLHHRNNRGENAIDRARRRGERTMTAIVVDGADYESSESSLIPEELASAIEDRIQRLLALSYPLDLYQDYYDMRNPANATDARRHTFGMVKQAIEAKRSGDIATANALYVRVCEDDEIPRSDYIWGWFKVLLLAKRYRDAYLVLRYYHAMSASYNHMRRDRGELSFDNTLIPDCFLSLKFEALPVFFESTHVWPIDKTAVEEKVTSFEGSPLWPRYTMTDGQYDVFLRYFLCNDYGDEASEEGAADQETERELLEAEVRSGSIDAHAPLARLVYAEDRERAIELCEEAVDAGDVGDAMFFLACLLEDTDRERSLQLYERLVSAGDHYGAASNLAYLIEDEDPDRAEGLFRMAMDAGNTNWAARGLADLIKNRDSDGAIELYETAVESGNVGACTSLAFLLQSRDPDKAMRLCEKAIESGDTYDSAYLLGWLLSSKDPARAKKYYEMAIEAGNTYWPANDLARLLLDEDRERALELLRLSADAGNNEARVTLARQIHDVNKEEAIDLCQQAVDSGDENEGLFYLAWLLTPDDRERAKVLYQRCIDAGYCSGAASNLGLLLKDEDPERAKGLFELAIESGNSFFATANLADMIAESDPERAVELYQASVNAGNLSSCAKLARLLIDADRERAKEVCEKAVEAGDRGDAAFVLAWLLEGSDLNRAKELYQECVDAGFCWGPARNLANIVRDEDPERATELYEMELQAGNVAVRVPLARLISSRDRQRAIQLCEEALEDGDVDDAPFYLAWLLEREDIERSKDLYQVCIDNGRSSSAASNLGLLVKAEDPTRAKELFELAIESGNSFYATANLADMLVEGDPERAAELYDKALQAGNTTVRVPLAKLLIDSDRQRAAQLFEEAIADGDEDEGLHWLAWMLEGTDRPRAIELYQRRIDAGNFWGSAFNLARLIESEEPKRALELYKMELESTNRGIAAESIANLLAYTLLQPDQATTYYEMAMDSGRDTDANCLNSYGVLLMTRDRDKAMGVFRQAIEAGNLSYATCNLGHMLFFEDPDEAESLYRTSMEHEAQSESTEAYIGLSLLLENSDPEQSSALLETAMSRANFRDSIEFMAEYYQCVNPAHSERLRAMTTEV